MTPIYSMNFGLYNLSAGDLLCVTEIKYANSKADVMHNILIIEEPQMEKTLNDSYWWTWGKWNDSTVYLLQWMYPYSTSIMVFTADPIKDKGSSSWSFTVLQATHHPLDP